MTINTPSHYCFYWGKVFLLGLALLFAGCGGGDDEPPSPLSTAYQGQAILGPLIGADVKIYPLSALNSAPVYTTTTSSSDRLDQAGLFTIPEDLVDDNELYLVKVAGGQDIDADDNGLIDDNPTPNQGAIHALLTPNQIRSNHFHISILTELLYQRLYYLLAADYPQETLLLELNRRAPLVLAADVDGDGDRDADDVAAWRPVRDAAKLRHGFEAYQPMIAAVHNGAPLTAMPLTGYVLSALEIDDTRGYAHGLAVLDGISYVGAGEAVRIVDARNPTKPMLLGSLSLAPDSVRDVAVANGIAYIAVSNGLRTVDVHDPAKPVLLGSLDLPDLSAGAVTVVEDIAYLGGNRGLYAVDVRDPAKPLTLGFSISSREQITTAIKVADGILYQVICIPPPPFGKVGASRVQIYDVHEPANPTLLTEWAESKPGCGENNIEVANGVAYLVWGWVDTTLEVFDVRDPTRPRSLSSLSIYGQSMAVTQGFAYFVTVGGIQVVDVRDPTNPTVLGLIDTGSANTGSMSGKLLSIKDGLAYLVDTLSGDGLRGPTLKVIDISNPFNAVMNPARVGSMGSDFLFSDGSMSSHFSDVAVVDKTVYVVGRITGAAMNGLYVIDAQDPANLILLGSLEPPYWLPHVAVAHGMAFVTNDNGLLAVDVNNPANPAFIKSFDLTPFPTDVIVTSNVAYVTTASSTRLDEAGNDVEFPASLYLLDARNPATLERLGSLSFGSGESRASGVAVVAVADGLAYVVVNVATITDWHSLLQVVDTRNPGQPVVIGSIPLFSSSDGSGYSYSAVATTDDIVYVVNAVNGLQLVDVHNPSSPFLLKSIPFDSLKILGDARNIVVADGFAYIAGSAGVQVMDIRDPLNPAHVFSLSTPSAANAVTISDGYVYVATDDPSGLQIFQAAVRQVP